MLCPKYRALCLRVHFLNSLWPSDIIWRHKSGTTLAQLMASCLTTPSHYLNQCWFIIEGVLWHFTRNAHELIRNMCSKITLLTHWDRVTHICVGKLTIIGSDNGMSPGRRQAIIRTNAGILLIRTLRTNFQWNLQRNSYIFIQENALKMSSAKWRQFCLGPRKCTWKRVNVLKLLPHLPMAHDLTVTRE